MIFNDCYSSDIWKIADIIMALIDLLKFHKLLAYEVIIGKRVTSQVFWGLVPDNSTICLILPWKFIDFFFFTLLLLFLLLFFLFFFQDRFFLKRRYRRTLRRLLINAWLDFNSIWNFIIDLGWTLAIFLVNISCRFVPLRQCQIILLFIFSLSLSFSNL